uniref:ATP synthase complex subunit 8 n=1 Tax=Curculionoidea sp. 26 KM-2017 TaxID=2219410 RepID=A0A346RJ16_9CUCU|nr:ATP synthase F0 subunit 8 [Curculionoidea sp. 26 KM-2017]
MPQMSPLNWLSLFSFFFFIFLLFNIFNYFSFLYKPLKSFNKTPTINKLTWKW